jgi:hypothetical protein
MSFMRNVLFGGSGGEALIGGSFLAEMIRGIPKIFKRVIIKLESELRRLNFFLLSVRGSGEGSTDCPLDVESKGSDLSVEGL